METQALTSGRPTGRDEAAGARLAQPPRGPHARAWEIVLEVVREHAGSLLRIARRHSLCPDDAQDAYQRALEIFVARAESLDPETTVAWLRTVVKHEAMAVRAGRQGAVGEEDVDFERHEDGRLASVEERAVGYDRLTRSAEALQRCKPHEAMALLLKAEGHSYREIADITGWTYTKVNRLLSEGRRRFLERYASIESGAECERWTPILSAMADGEAAAEDLLAARPHLRRCAACRATLREFHWAPGHVAALAPLGGAPALAGAGHGAHGLLVRLYEGLTGGLHERVTLSAVKVQSAVEAASVGKVTAIAASTAALAGGGVAVNGAVENAPRPAAGASIGRVVHRAEARRRRLRALRAVRAAVAAPGSADVAPAAASIRHAVTSPAPATTPTSPPPSDRAPAESAPSPSSSPPAAPAPTAQSAPAREFGPEQAATPAPTSTGTRHSSVSQHRSSGGGSAPSTSNSEFGP